MPVTDLSPYAREKDEAELRARPSIVLADPSKILDTITVDVETTDLHTSDGATVAAVSVAYRLTEDPDYVHHFAFPFDQGRSADKGFHTVLHSDGPTYRKQGVVGLPKGDPFGFWDWETDYNLPESEWWFWCEWVAEACARVGLNNHNLKFDLHHLRNGTRHWHGVELEQYAEWCTQLGNAEIWPTELQALKVTGARLWGDEVADEAAAVKAALIEAKKRYGLTKETGPRYDLIPWEVNGPYVSQDTVLALWLREEQQRRLDLGMGSWKRVQEAVKLMRVLYRMERRGFGPIDLNKAWEEANRIDDRLSVLMPQVPFDPPTAPRAAEYYFEERGYEPWVNGEERRVKELVDDNRKNAPAPTRVKVTKQGALNSRISRRMAEQYGDESAEVWAEILDLSIGNRMFWRNYAQLADEDGMIRTSFKQSFVKSGRMSVERWQAQAIPKHTDLALPDGPLCQPRSLFLVKPGLVRVNFDLTQAELRIAAKFAGCQTMIDQLSTGADFHGNTTRAVFDITPEAPNWFAMRDIGKRLTFSSIFQVGPKTFQWTLWDEAGIAWPYSQAAAAIYAWRDTYPEFTAAYEYWERRFERTGYVVLADNNPSWLKKNIDYPRTGWSRVVQSSLALFVRDWLIKIEQKTARWDALVLTVHDSCVLSLPEEHVDEICQWVIEMTRDLWFEWFGIEGGCERSEWAKG